MIENEIKQQAQATTTSNVTSPISKADSKETTKKTNAFKAWLNDKDTIDENGGKISAKDAATSYAKGLIEIVKTAYKKPLVCGITVVTGAVLTFFAHYSALSIVMGIAAAAGAAGMAYAGYTIATAKSSNNKKQAYEVLGISSLVLGLGIYGLLF